MKVVVTQELIDRQIAQHYSGKHWPCLTEVAIEEAMNKSKTIHVGTDGDVYGSALDSAFGHVKIGYIDDVGINLLYRYDRNDFNRLVPCEFEFTPTE